MARKTSTRSLHSNDSLVGPIEIPYGFDPRTYQKPSMAYSDGGGSRAVTVWHRRAGKDQTWLNQTIKRALREDFCGTYLHIFPRLTQGRRDLWDAKSSPRSGGKPFRSHFHPELVMESSETEMQITLKPMPHQRPQPIPDGKGGYKYVGSIWQIMGTDKESLENIRGINAAGVVFSEFSDQDPSAWHSILEPVLLENGGWAAFDFTPKGKNHAYDIYTYALTNPNWFAQLLNIEQTRRDAPGEDGSPVMPLEEVDELRRRGVPEEIIQQEYYCSFDGFLQGTIYGDVLKEAYKQDRVCDVPYNRNLPVGVMFDIGWGDGTAIWFYQVPFPGGPINFIDYYSNNRKGADHYVAVMREKGYLYGRIVLPHDAKWFASSGDTPSTGDFLFQTLCHDVSAAPIFSIPQGIDIVRRMFSRFYFDRKKCDTRPHPKIPSGLECLASYHRSWDEQKASYSKDPVHDQYSHGADALRTGCVRWEDFMSFTPHSMQKEVKVITDFDPRFQDTGIGF